MVGEAASMAKSDLALRCAKAVLLVSSLKATCSPSVRAVEQVTRGERDDDEGDPGTQGGIGEREIQKQLDRTLWINRAGDPCFVATPVSCSSSPSARVRPYLKSEMAYVHSSISA
ncbi:hypothetical protein LINPERHAP2_LOCUS1977 [Linum perenne]